MANLANISLADIIKQLESATNQLKQLQAIQEKDQVQEPVALTSSKQIGPVEVYTDGACPNNGQPGARAGIGVWWPHNPSWNLSERLGGRQTNNRAEIHAAVRAIEIAKENGVQSLLLHTDSNLLYKGMTEWLSGWKKKGWKDVINHEDFKNFWQCLRT